MNSLAYILRYSILVFIILLLTLNIIPDICLAQNEGPKIKMTIFIVPEKKACREDGYIKYEDEQSSNCKPLSMADIAYFEKKYEKTIQICDIPPSKIKLGDNLYKILDAYRTAGKNTPEKRQSLVFVFEWTTFQNSPISLERTIKREHTDIPAMKWQGELRNEKHWIHHERADAIDPLDKIIWVLKANMGKWEFYTGR